MRSTSATYMCEISYRKIWNNHYLLFGVACKGAEKLQVFVIFSLERKDSRVWPMGPDSSYCGRENARRWTDGAQTHL